MSLTEKNQENQGSLVSESFIVPETAQEADQRLIINFDINFLESGVQLGESRDLIVDTEVVIDGSRQSGPKVYFGAMDRFVPWGVAVKSKSEVYIKVVFSTKNGIGKFEDSYKMPRVKVSYSGNQFCDEENAKQELKDYEENLARVERERDGVVKAQQEAEKTRIRNFKHDLAKAVDAKAPFTHCKSFD
jgi:hypothetical protein